MVNIGAGPHGETTGVDDSPPAPAGCNRETKGRPLALARRAGEEERIALSAAWVKEEFDAYYRDSRAIPGLARAAFEERDYASSVALSHRRLGAYRQSIGDFGPRLRSAWPALAEDERRWGAIETRYLPLIEASYEADLALAYLHSVRRQVYQGEWRPVDYVFRERSAEAAFTVDRIYAEFPLGSRPWSESVSRILELPGFRRP